MVDYLHGTDHELCRAWRLCGPNELWGAWGTFVGLAGWSKVWDRVLGWLVGMWGQQATRYLHGLSGAVGMTGGDVSVWRC